MLKVLFFYFAIAVVASAGNADELNNSDLLPVKGKRATCKILNFKIINENIRHCFLQMDLTS